LHAAHVIGGLVTLSLLAFFSNGIHAGHRAHSSRSSSGCCIGILVDVIWIFLCLSCTSPGKLLMTIKIHARRVEVTRSRRLQQAEPRHASGRVTSYAWFGVARTTALSFGADRLHLVRSRRASRSAWR